MNRFVAGIVGLCCAVAMAQANAILANSAGYANDISGSGGFPPDENFDGVTAPALPAGWSTTFNGAGVAWASTTTFADTAPNAAFAPDLGAIADMIMESPVFTPVTGQRVAFRHKYALESPYDGAVLEISSDGGATFQDILAAGGSFTSGGYNGTISSNFSSPIAGRPAWTGDSGGFVTTEVALPAATVGQPTMLRFRTADDSSVGSGGWWVDTIHLAADPAIDISPANLSASQAADRMTTQTLTIGNTGGDDLDWSITEATALLHHDATRAGAIEGGPGPWTNASPLPANLVRYAFAQVGDVLYVAGGVANGTVVGTLYRYDTASDTWTTLAPMPTATGEAPTGAYFNGKLYVVGGNSVNVLNIYDIATDSWSSGAPIPQAGGTYGAAGGAYNGRFFVAGGTGGTASTTLWVYDIGSDSWNSGTALPSAYQLGGYQQVGKYVYMVGGYGAAPRTPYGPASMLSGYSQTNVIAPSANASATLRLDMSSPTGTWTTGPTWTMNRADFALAYDPAGNSLYAIGGDADGGGYFDTQSEVDQLDISAWPAGTWVVSAPALPAPLQANQAGFHSTGVAGGEIWSTGGIDSTMTFHNTHQYRTNAPPSACSSPSDIPWVSVSPSSGTTAPGDSSDVTVTFDSTGLADGTYGGTLCITSNDPAVPLVEVPVSLQVMPAAPFCDGGADEIFCDGFDGAVPRMAGLVTERADLLAGLLPDYEDNGFSSVTGKFISMARADYATYYNPAQIAAQITN